MPKWEIKASADEDPGVGVIELLYEIDHTGWWGVSAAQFARALRRVGKKNTLRVIINSYGGDVFDGIAMRSHLERWGQEHGATVEVEVAGIAALAASIVMCAATPGHRVMRTGSFVMIHNAWSVSAGDHHELRQVADVLEAIADEMSGIYELATGMEPERIRQLMDAETWMGSKKAVELKFADVVSDEAAVMPEEGDQDARAERAARAFAARLGIGERDAPPIAALVMSKPPAASAAKESLVPDARGAAAAPDASRAEDGAALPVPPAEAAPSAPAPSQAAATAATVPSTVTTGQGGEAMDETIEELTANIRTRQEKAEDIIGKARAEGRRMTAEERKKVEGWQAENDEDEEELRILQNAKAKKTELEQPNGRRSAPADKPAKADTQIQITGERTHAQRIVASGRAEFSSLGEFLIDVKSSSPSSMSRKLERLHNAAEQTGAVNEDGGFLMPYDFRTELYDTVLGQNALAARTLRLQTTARSVIINKRNIQPWQEKGFEVFWTAEGQEYVGSKTGTGQVESKVKKATVLMYASEESLEDAASLEAMMRLDAEDKLDFAVSNAIVRGPGGPLMPMGYMNSGATIVVPPSTPSAAGSLTFDDVANMYARMSRRDRPFAFWLISPSLTAKLITMRTPDGDRLITYSPGTIDQAPKMMLLGHEVMEHEVCNAAGTVGDIMFVSLARSYLMAERTQVQMQDTMFVEWVRDVRAFKLTYRVSGDPLWDAPIKSRDGDFTQSPFITLGERAG